MPAMPQSATESGYGCNYGNEIGQVAQGLTKREMIAMHIIGHLANGTDGYDEQVLYKTKVAVKYADALLSELNK